MYLCPLLVMLEAAGIILVDCKCLLPARGAIRGAVVVEKFHLFYGWPLKRSIGSFQARGGRHGDFGRS